MQYRSKPYRQYVDRMCTDLVQIVDELHSRVAVGLCRRVCVSYFLSFDKRALRFRCSIFEDRSGAELAANC